MTIRAKRDAGKYNKTPGSHGTTLKPQPKRSAFQWLTRMDRKLRYLVAWDDVHEVWSPKKLTLPHALQLAEEQARELLARPNAGELREARERARKLVELLEGQAPPAVPVPARKPGVVLGGRAGSIDGMRQRRRTDNGT